ncbi:hypothetical protein H6F50_14305 [Coleofasciculus sp. FACHB-712]|uniref:hypothetical protein n=1 Tax=Coleofasciculus sp. FACHB-712 TaxID=2692789 RepID=UPI001683D954|nr:hypothetical protein [Coleofasciculus sp. FACHB-712]MBD1943513.1 hypothetical protein [Coleofasciculus sp. FACHB-712]
MQTLQQESAQTQREKRSLIPLLLISHPQPGPQAMPKLLELQRLQALMRQMASSRKKVALIFTTIPTYLVAMLKERYPILTQFNFRSILKSTIRNKSSGFSSKFYR